MNVCNEKLCSVFYSSVDTARHRYCPPVSRSALSLETDLTVKAKTSDDNSDMYLNSTQIAVQCLFYGV
ncbi:protein NUCLEOLAR COMPLEX ASSOCIATED [Trifolium repens]|nr:protein NUCLEOLAR COMPLEX ASSOCIATED [Trifolium repens]